VKGNHHKPLRCSFVLMPKGNYLNENKKQKIT